MKKFCVITNEDKDKNCQTAAKVREYLVKKGLGCTLASSAIRKEGAADGVRTYTNADEIPEDVECAIVLGGDGTMIQAANDLAYRDIPIFGVNLGGLGFLTAIDQRRALWGLDEVLLGRCRIENRMMLECGLGDGKWQALNDFVVGKKDYGKLIRVQITINGEWMDEYVADGVIVSTPTGSTAYNLSAGGPVLAPETRVVVITPICPHSLNKRSLVVSAEDVLEIRLGQGKQAHPDQASLISDGRDVAKLTEGDVLRVTESSVSTKIVRLMDASFYGKLRSKLGGGNYNEGRAAGEDYRAD